MIELLSAPEFSIYKNTDNLFKLMFQKNSQPLVNSIIKTKQIIATNICDDYTFLFFRASSVKSFKQFISKNKNITYENTLKLIFSLTKQLEYLIKIEHKCYYQIDIENIIVIDNYHFLYLSNENLMDLSDSNNLLFFKPFCRDGFISPEIANIKIIPAEIHFKTIYYSLGLLIIYFLFNTNINNLQDLKEILQPIGETKLSAFIYRCLTEKIEDRNILYI
jgi:hypothetical protein